MNANIGGVVAEIPLVRETSLVAGYLSLFANPWFLDTGFWLL